MSSHEETFDESAEPGQASWPADESTFDTALAAAIERLPEGTDHNLEWGCWLELARATNHGECPDCGQASGPAWDAVEPTGGTGSALGVMATHGWGQCGGCGVIGQGWVSTGSVDLSDVDPADLDDAVTKLLTKLDEEWNAEIERITEQRVGQLRRDLTKALNLVAAGAEADDVTTGTFDEPGIILKDDYNGTGEQLVAWDFAPNYEGNWDDIIEVRADDIAGYTRWS